MTDRWSDANTERHQGDVALHPIRSEALHAVGYDPDRAVLIVQFASGELYEYQGVAEDLYERLLEAQPHPWSQLGAEVLAHEDRHIGRNEL